MKSSSLFKSNQTHWLSLPRRYERANKHTLISSKLIMSIFDPMSFDLIFARGTEHPQTWSQSEKIYQNSSARFLEDSYQESFHVLLKNCYILIYTQIFRYSVSIRWVENWVIIYHNRLDGIEWVHCKFDTLTVLVEKFHHFSILELTVSGINEAQI